jgi:threonine dehydrogenase-like Zn-dependent dehydrogenase
VLFLSDIFPTGYMGAEMCDIQPGDTIAIWGCGPVGQFSIRSAFLLGAERVIAIDAVPERLQMAEQGGAETINYEEQNVYEALMEMTGGRGPDACIDDVGMEAHAPGIIFAYDRVKQAMMLETDRPHALREAIMCCRNGGTISVIGVYGARATIHASVTGDDRERRHRSDVCHHTPDESRGRATRLRHVQEQRGQLYQGGVEARLEWRQQ